LADPEMLTCDFAKMSMPANLHLAFQVLSQFEKQYNALPKPWDEV
jgi:ubiquitin-activating enzyme E1